MAPPGPRRGHHPLSVDPDAFRRQRNALNGGAVPRFARYRAPYSGSEGEMLREGFCTVAWPRGCGKSLLSSTGRYASVDQSRHPAATNRVARHSMSEDRAPSGRDALCFQTNSQMSSSFQDFTIRLSRRQRLPDPYLNRTEDTPCQLNSLHS
jgi:hypothetical protein